MPRGRERKFHIPSPWNRKYSRAMAQAKHRNEEWAFTPESWYKLWCDSGVKEHSGREPHQYCMVRKDIIEAWGPHNCIIVTRRKHLSKLSYESMHQYERVDWEDRHGVGYEEKKD